MLIRYPLENNENILIIKVYYKVGGWALVYGQYPTSIHSCAQTDGRTDGRTDGQGDSNILPQIKTLFAGGITKIHNSGQTSFI